MKFGTQKVKQEDDIAGRYKDISTFVSGGPCDYTFDNRKKFYDRDNPYPQILNE